MNVKQKIIQRINSINDPKILLEILNLISSETMVDEIYHFNNKEKKNVMEGIEDADSGNVVNQEESENLISEWLREKSNGH